MRQKTLLADDSETSRLTLSRKLDTLLSQKAISVCLVYPLGDFSWVVNGSEGVFLKRRQHSDLKPSEDSSPSVYLNLRTFLALVPYLRWD